MATKLTRSNNVVWEELGSETLLVNPTSGARWLLNAAASAVWKLCDGTRSVAELAASLTMSRAEITQHCGIFEQNGLLQMAGASAHEAHMSGGPGMRVMSLGTGGRKRPNPRGISGPA